MSPGYEKLPNVRDLLLKSENFTQSDSSGIFQVLVKQGNQSPQSYKMYCFGLSIYSEAHRPVFCSHVNCVQNAICKFLSSFWDFFFLIVSNSDSIQTYLLISLYSCVPNSILRNRSEQKRCVM
jgi:hypothetical protein